MRILLAPRTKYFCLKNLVICSKEVYLWSNLQRLLQVLRLILLSRLFVVILQLVSVQVRLLLKLCLNSPSILMMEILVLSDQEKVVENFLRLCYIYLVNMNICMLSRANILEQWFIPLSLSSSLWVQFMFCLSRSCHQWWVLCNSLIISQFRDLPRSWYLCPASWCIKNTHFEFDWLSYYWSYLRSDLVSSDRNIFSDFYWEYHLLVNWHSIIFWLNFLDTWGWCWVADLII